MNKNTKKPKILLPKKIKPVSESTTFNSRGKHAETEHPLSSTLQDGGVPAQAKMRHVLEEISEIREESRNTVNHNIRTIVEEISKENSAPKQSSSVNSVKICKSREEHQIKCDTCSGFRVKDKENEDPETHDRSVNNAPNEGQCGTKDTSTHKTILQPFCSSFNADISKVPNRMEFQRGNSVSAISGDGNASTCRLSTIPVNQEQHKSTELESNKNEESGMFKEALRTSDFDIIKLNDSSSKCEYQFYNGVHQRFCSSFHGNGFNVPSQIHFDCDPSLSAITKSTRKITENVSNVSKHESTMTEAVPVDVSSSRQSVETPFCSSFREDISELPSHLTFNLEETLTEVPSQRYNLRIRTPKQIEAIEEESEDEESTLKPSSELESDSELIYNNEGSASSESEAEDGECEWLKDHKLSCNVCQDANGKADLEAVAHKPRTVTSRQTGKLFSCDKCDKAFGNKHNLNRHLVRHKGLKPFRCTMCNKCFTQSGNLQVHIRTAHDGKKDFTCSTCGVAFGLKHSLKVHIRTVHEGKKDFTCSTCGIAFGHKANLSQHLRIHDGTKPFNCSQCPKSFSRKSHLTVHLRIHDGFKPFNCSECPKSFTHKSTLTVHRRIHDGIKPFSCSECPKSFADNSNFNRHKRIHGNDKSFACSSCDKRFTQKAELRRHEMRVHKENLDEDSDSDSS